MYPSVHREKKSASLRNCSKARKNFLPVNLQHLFFLSTHQVDVELSHSHSRQFAKLLMMSLNISQQAKAIYYVIRNEVRVIALHLAMMLIIVVPAILYVGG